MYFVASSRSIFAWLRAKHANPVTHKHLEVSQKGSSFFVWAALLCLGCIATFVVPNAQAQNLINTVAGGAVVSGTATAADIPGPQAVIEDASGNFYIAAPYSYNVFKLTPSGAISVFAGIGVQGFSGDNGPASAAALSLPAGLAIDSAGNIYIADLNTIREVAVNGIITTIAGTGTVCAPSWGQCGDTGLATSAQLTAPQGMVVDASGNVYIADTQDNRVRLITKSTGVITTIAGTGHFCDGPTEQCGDKGPATAALLDYPTGIVLDSFGDVVFTDTRDQRIRCIVGSTGGCNNAAYPAGDIVTVVGTGQFCEDPGATNGCGNKGPASNAHLYNPEGLVQDSSGNLYFADQLDSEVREVTISNWIINAAAGTGVPGFSGDGGTATKAQLDLPYGVWIDHSGNLWTADAGNQRVREISGGNINTVAGGGSGGDGGAATLATLANPQSVNWDSQGNYYIADSANNRIRKVSAGSNTITTIAGTGSAGWSGDNGPPTSATLNNPFGVAIDASGNIYVSDTRNYVIREISNGVISTIAGTYGVQCDPPTGQCGDGGPATSASLSNPNAVSVDNLGNLYIADSFGNRIRQVNLSTGIITTAAGTGVFGHSGDGGPATQAEVNRPTGVANDVSGNIYIADTQDNKVRCVLAVLLGCGGSALPVDDIMTFAFTGTAGFSGDGGPAIKAKTITPSQVAVDPVGNVYVGGGGTSVVRRIDAATLTIDTVAGNPEKPGDAGFAGDGGAATKAALDNSGLSVNSAKSLLIADNGNNRIRQTNMVPVLTANKTALNFPNTKVGTSSAPMSVKLTNIGADDQPFGTFEIVGQDSGDFTIQSSSTCPSLPESMLAPDLSCVLSVVFTPQATGLRTAFLKVSNLTERLPLSGTGD